MNRLSLYDRVVIVLAWAALGGFCLFLAFVSIARGP
jgi:hypothetical protein